VQNKKVKLDKDSAEEPIATEAEDTPNNLEFDLNGEPRPVV
jgi:hypothetical protein